MPEKPVAGDHQSATPVLRVQESPASDHYQTFQLGTVGLIQDDDDAYLIDLKAAAKTLRAVQLQRSIGERALSAPCTLKLEGRGLERLIELRQSLKNSDLPLRSLVVALSWWRESHRHFPDKHVDVVLNRLLEHPGVTALDRNELCRVLGALSCEHQGRATKSSDCAPTVVGIGILARWSASVSSSR